MVYWPWPSVVAVAASAMPAPTSTRTTLSPEEGLPVVLLVTVPLTVAAQAEAAIVNNKQMVGTRENRITLICIAGSYGALVGNDLKQRLILALSSCNKTLRRPIMAPGE